jgi:CheY-like chemotaxis protein
LDLPSISETVTPPRGEGETILVVEDDAAVRLLITGVLEELGYRYFEASGSPQAMTILQTGARIDLLLTDVGLPIMNGRQLAEFARESRPEIRVLFVTGYAENAAVRGGFLDRGMDMLTKPFALNTLGLKIREMIGPVN